MLDSSSLQQAIETSNSALGSTILRELSEELARKDNAIRVQQRRSNMSFMVAVIGVILTIVFGVLSFV
jgi:hypothetical protein